MVLVDTCVLLLVPQDCGYNGIECTGEEEKRHNLEILENVTLFPF